jgi:hypothetical protein
VIIALTHIIPSKLEFFPPIRRDWVSPLSSGKWRRKEIQIILLILSKKNHLHITNILTTRYVRSANRIAADMGWETSAFKGSFVKFPLKMA